MLEQERPKVEVEKQFAKAKRLCNDNDNAESLHLVNLKINENMLYKKSVHLGGEETANFFLSYRRSCDKQGKGTCKQDAYLKKIFLNLQHSIFSSSVEFSSIYWSQTFKNFTKTLDG